MAYEINYNDERLTQVNEQRDAALADSTNTYNQMINSADGYYQAQMDAVNQWGETQSQLQQEQTDFAIEQIEQQKAQAQQDYVKEQTGAWVDYQKQVNDYGTNAERMAEMGLASSGYSESSRIAMYNSYQNRYAMARETYNRAVLDYDNAIKEARLQNNSILAELAYNSLMQRLELSLQGFQYKNELLRESADRRAEIEDRYHTRWQDVLQQMNTENALAEQIRQHNESIAEERRQYDLSLAEEQRQHNETLAEEKRQHNIEYGSTNINGGSGTQQLSGGNSLTTYQEAVDYMKSNGASDGVGGLMTRSEWSRRRASYQSSGIGGAEVKNYSTYSEYITDYVEYYTS